MRHLARLIPYLMRYRRQLILAVTAVVLSVVFVLASPLLVGWAIDFGLKPIEDAEGNPIGVDVNATFLILASLGVIAFALGRGIATFTQQYLAESIGQTVAYDLRNSIYDNIQRLSYAYHDKAHTGQIMSRATQDVEYIRIFVNMGAVRAVYIALLLVVSLAGMFVLHWGLALVSVVTLPVIAYRSIVVNNQMRPVWQQIQENQAQMTQIAEEGLSGIRVVKAFSREDYESEKFYKISQEQADLQYYQAKLMAMHGPLMRGLSMLQIAVTAGFGAWLITQNSLQPGTLATFVLWLSLLQLPVRSLGFVVTIVSRGVSACERVFELVDAESEVTEKPDAIPLENVRGHVRFDHVSFGYDTERGVLDDITIDAPPGKVVALLGPTGSGKSSVVNLIPRFYDARRGSVTIDGTDVRDVTIESLRRSIGIVQQDVFLFVGTIRDNIAYGKPDATQAEIERAAKAARIHEFIVSLPYGYDEWVGEKGVTLSGGQKQRIAIARTLLLDPRILIFDDSTASVDTQTEFLIQLALQELMKNRTTFVIAQRLRTVMRADEIIVLDKGKVVQRGTHDELLEQEGLYRRIYDLELKGQEEALGEVTGRTNGHREGAPRTHVATPGGGN